MISLDEIPTPYLIAFAVVLVSIVLALAAGCLPDGREDKHRRN